MSECSSQLLARKYETAVTSGVERCLKWRTCRIWAILFNSRLNTCRCYHKTVFLETPVNIFGEESSKEPEILKVLEFFVGASAPTMLPSAEFICLRVAYREVFWEELSRLI